MFLDLSLWGRGRQLADRGLDPDPVFQQTKLSTRKKIHI